MRISLSHMAILAAGVVAATVGVIGAPAAAETAPDASSSIVEDYAYPNAAQILAERHVKLISGDGRIVLVDCATPTEGDIGLLKVWTTDETIGTDGIGLVCFKLSGNHGVLLLEVPGVYEFRGDGQRSGTGHQVTANLTTDEGDKTSVAVNPSGSTQVGMGKDKNNPPTTLLRLEVTG